MDNEKLLEFQERIDYQFNKISKLNKALTHPFNHVASESYEVYEFFGDAILEFIVSEILFFENKNTTPGKLTKERQKLVSRTALAKTYDYLKLDDYIIGKPINLEEISEKSKSDFVEALIAAIYLDSNDLAITKKFILKFIFPFGDEQILDMKSKLFEYCAKNRVEYTLNYETDNLNPPMHIAILNIFNAQFIGKATTKKEAVKIACEKCVEKMNLVL